MATINTFAGSETSGRPGVSPLLKWPAVVISYLFHPLFVPLYIVWFLVYIHAFYFTGFSEKQRMYTFGISFVNLVMFPLITVVLLRLLHFIDSIFLKSRKDRIIPYIASSIFYFWAYLVFKRQPEYPLVLTSLVLGIFISVNAALIANIYLKISMHALGMGGWFGYFLILAFSGNLMMAWPLAVVILISGLVCTARLLVSDHTNGEIYTGFALGMIGQFVAAWLIL